MARFRGMKKATVLQFHSLLERLHRKEQDVSILKVENYNLEKFKDAWVRYLSEHTEERRVIILREIVNELGDEIRKARKPGR